MKNVKLKKPLLLICISIVSLVLLVIIFISPITKYLVEKYSVKYTGRQIRMDWAYVNPFTGYVHFSNFKVHELKSDSVFFSSEGLTLNFAMFKLLSKTYEIEYLHLSKPKGTISQKKDIFNFDDIIDKFSSKAIGKPGPPVHFNILKVNISDGVFYYSEIKIPIKYYIKEVNLECSGKSWNADTTAGTFSFVSGPGTGNVKGTFFLNFKNLDYRFHVIARQFDLKILEQYLHELSSYGTFSAYANTDVTLKGNFNDVKSVDIKGLMEINDMHFGKKRNDDYMSWKKLDLQIEELNPRKKIYLFDSFVLSNPFFKFEQYDHHDNYSMMFGVNVANLAADTIHYNLIQLLASYIKTLGEDFLKSDYKINKIAIYDGNLEYNDYTPNEKFGMEFNPVTIRADSIYKSHARDNIYLRSGIKPYGNLIASLNVNPRDVGDFTLRYSMEKVPSAMFNPYLITYSSFPLDKGTIEMNGAWSLKNSYVNSTNHLLVIDPRVAQRVKKDDTKWLPMPLIMAFIRERGNVIDYKIPVSGDLKNPSFHLHDIIVDALQNIVMKPAYTPYRFEVRSIERTIEKAHTMKWTMRQTKMTRRQDRFVSRITDFLKKFPEASISVYPMEYSDKEKEYILFYQAKMKYYLLTHGMSIKNYTEDDSERVDKISFKDPGFAKFINKAIPDKMMYTLQQKCNAFVGENYVNSLFNKLKKDRETAFLDAFTKKGVRGQVKMLYGENTIPYNGFSYYKIIYKGDIPPKLAEAYQSLDELNSEEPRKDYLSERKKEKE